MWFSLNILDWVVLGFNVSNLSKDTKNCWEKVVQSKKIEDKWCFDIFTFHIIWICEFNGRIFFFSIGNERDVGRKKSCMGFSGFEYFRYNLGIFLLFFSHLFTIFICLNPISLKKRWPLREKHPDPLWMTAICFTTGLYSQGQVFFFLPRTGSHFCPITLHSLFFLRHLMDMSRYIMITIV